MPSSSTRSNSAPAADRHPGLQPDVGQHEAGDGLLHGVRIDAAVGPHVADRHGGVGVGGPAVAGTEALQRLARVEHVDHRARLAAGLKADRCAGGAVVAGGLATDAQRPLAMFGADHEGAAQHGGKHQHPGGARHHVLRAWHQVVQTRQGFIHRRIDGGAGGGRRRLRLRRAGDGAARQPRAAQRQRQRQAQALQVPTCHVNQPFCGIAPATHTVARRAGRRQVRQNGAALSNASGWPVTGCVSRSAQACSIRRGAPSGGPYRVSPTIGWPIASRCTRN